MIYCISSNCFLDFPLCSEMNLCIVEPPISRADLFVVPNKTKFFFVSVNFVFNVLTSVVLPVPAHPSIFTPFSFAMMHLHR